MLGLGTMISILSLSSSFTQPAHATPLDLHPIPYRCHYPTPVAVVPAAAGRAAPAVADRDAPSGREGYVREKDKYGEDYTLEEIEFTHGDIGETGKLDYYIDGGIDYYDVDIFAEAYSGEKTPPKTRPKFGANEENERRVDNVEDRRFQDGVMPVQGRHFDLFGGNPGYQPSRKVSVGPSSDTAVKDFDGYSGQNYEAGRSFDSYSGNLYHQTYQQSTVSPSFDLRVKSFVGYPGQNFEADRSFDSYSGNPYHQTYQQRTVSPSFDLNVKSFVGYSGQNIEADRSFDSYSGNPHHQTYQQSTVSPSFDSREKSFVGYPGQNIHDGRSHISNNANPDQISSPQAKFNPVSDAKVTGFGGYTGQNNQQDDSRVNSYSAIPNYQSYEQSTVGHTFDSRGESSFDYSGQNNQDGRRFNSYNGRPEYQTAQQVTVKPQNSAQNTQEDARLIYNSGSPGYKTSQQSTVSPLSDLTAKDSVGNTGYNIEDGRSFSSYSGRPDYQSVQPYLKEYVVTSRSFSNRGRTIYRLSGQGRGSQGQLLKSRVETKDEIMDAVE